MTRRATLDVQLIATTSFMPPVDMSGKPIFWPDATNEVPTPLGAMRQYDGQALAEFAGRACYQAWERKRPETATNKGYLANIQRQSHWSVLEHAQATFYIQGVSRALTHELVRHRHMSYSQLSQRYVDSSDVKFVVPPLIEELRERQIARVQSEDGFQGYFVNPETGTHHTAEEFREITLDRYVEKQFAPAATGYAETEEFLREYFPEFKRKQIREAARSVLPNATETKIVVTGNYRSWAEFLTKRDSLAADAEFQRLAKALGTLLADLAPNVFGDEARALWDHAFAEQGASSI